MPTGPTPKQSSASSSGIVPMRCSAFRRFTAGWLRRRARASRRCARCGTSDGLRTGTPFPIAEVRLLDAQGDEAAPGEPGVLWLRHPAQARGYANLPEETRAQFRDGWFCSRDLFVRDAQGFYIHQGRADELVKVAGQWVWPAELEEAALG